MTSASWPVPRYLLDLVPFKWGTYSRFGHSTLPMHYDISPLGMMMHFLAAPLKWLWWRIVELMFRFQFRLSGDLVPSTRIEHDLFSGGVLWSLCSASSSVFLVTLCLVRALSTTFSLVAYCGAYVPLPVPSFW